MRIKALLTAAILLGAITMTPGCHHNNGGNTGNAGNGSSSGSGGGSTTSNPPPAPVVLPDLDYEQIARDSGILAASAYVGFNSTSSDQASAIKKVCDLIKQNLKSFQAGGFSSASGQMNTLIDQSFTGNQAMYAAVAKLFAGMLLSELDGLFAGHADWSSDGVKVAGVIGAFCDGASATLASYGVRGVLPKEVFGRKIIKSDCNKGHCTIHLQ